MRHFGDDLLAAAAQFPPGAARGGRDPAPGTRGQLGAGEGGGKVGVGMGADDVLLCDTRFQNLRGHRVKFTIVEGMLILF